MVKSDNELEEEENEMQKLKNSVTSMETELAEKRQFISTVSTELSDSKMELATANMKIDLMTKRIDELVKSEDQLNEKIENMQKDHQDSHRKFHQLESTNQELKATLDHEKASYKRLKDTMEEISNDYERRLSHLQNQVGELNKLIQRNIEEKESMVKELNGKITKLTKENQQSTIEKEQEVRNQQNLVRALQNTAITTKNILTEFDNYEKQTTSTIADHMKTTSLLKQQIKILHENVVGVVKDSNERMKEKENEWLQKQQKLQAALDASTAVMEQAKSALASNEELMKKLAELTKETDELKAENQKLQSTCSSQKELINNLENELVEERNSNNKVLSEEDLQKIRDEEKAIWMQKINEIQKEMSHNDKQITDLKEQVKSLQYQNSKMAENMTELQEDLAAQGEAAAKSRRKSMETTADCCEAGTQTTAADMLFANASSDENIPHEIGLERIEQILRASIITKNYYFSKETNTFSNSYPIDETFLMDLVRSFHQMGREMSALLMKSKEFQPSGGEMNDDTEKFLAATAQDILIKLEKSKDEMIVRVKNEAKDEMAEKLEETIKHLTEMKHNELFEQEEKFTMQITQMKTEMEQKTKELKDELECMKQDYEAEIFELEHELGELEHLAGQKLPQPGGATAVDGSVANAVNAVVGAMSLGGFVIGGSAVPTDPNNPNIINNNNPNFFPNINPNNTSPNNNAINNMISNVLMNNNLNNVGYGSGGNSRGGSRPASRSGSISVQSVDALLENKAPQSPNVNMGEGGDRPSLSRMSSSSDFLSPTGRPALTRRGSVLGSGGRRSTTRTPLKSSITERDLATIKEDIKQQFEEEVKAKIYKELATVQSFNENVMNQTNKEMEELFKSLPAKYHNMNLEAMRQELLTGDLSSIGVVRTENFDRLKNKKFGTDMMVALTVLEHHGRYDSGESLPSGSENEEQQQRQYRMQLKALEIKRKLYTQQIVQETSILDLYMYLHSTEEHLGLLSSLNAWKSLLYYQSGGIFRDVLEVHRDVIHNCIKESGGMKAAVKALSTLPPNSETKQWPQEFRLKALEIFRAQLNKEIAKVNQSYDQLVLVVARSMDENQSESMSITEIAQTTMSEDNKKMFNKILAQKKLQPMPLLERKGTTMNADDLAGNDSKQLQGAGNDNSSVSKGDNSEADNQQKNGKNNSNNKRPPSASSSESASTIGALPSDLARKNSDSSFRSSSNQPVKPAPKLNPRQAKLEKAKQAALREDLIQLAENMNLLGANDDGNNKGPAVKSYEKSKTLHGRMDEITCTALRGSQEERKLLTKLLDGFFNWEQNQNLVATNIFQSCLGMNQLVDDVITAIIKSINTSDSDIPLIMQEIYDKVRRIVDFYKYNDEVIKVRACCILFESVQHSFI
jgi:hypothetical protein